MDFVLNGPCNGGTLTGLRNGPNVSDDIDNAFDQIIFAEDIHLQKGLTKVASRFSIIFRC